MSQTPKRPIGDGYRPQPQQPNPSLPKPDAGYQPTRTHGDSPSNPQQPQSPPRKP